MASAAAIVRRVTRKIEAMGCALRVEGDGPNLVTRIEGSRWGQLAVLAWAEEAGVGALLRRTVVSLWVEDAPLHRRVKGDIIGLLSPEKRAKLRAHLLVDPE